MCVHKTNKRLQQVIQIARDLLERINNSITKNIYTTAMSEISGFTKTKFDQNLRQKLHVPLKQSQWLRHQFPPQFV